MFKAVAVLGVAACAVAVNVKSATKSTLKSAVASKAAAMSVVTDSPAGTTMGKQGYINFIDNCFTGADAAASGSYDYHDTWDDFVNNCIFNEFYDPNTPYPSQPYPPAWGKQDYINFEWACFA